MMRPARGIVIVRKLATEDTIGSIVVPPTTHDRMTAQQWEVVAVGEPPLYEEDAAPESFFHADDQVHRLQRNGRTLYWRENSLALRPGAWIIAEPRVALPLGDYKHSLLATHNVAAIVLE